MDPSLFEVDSTNPGDSPVSPRNVRRMFPASGENDITRIVQFDTGTPLTNPTVSPDTWPSLSIDIINSEEFFLNYENAILVGGGSTNPDGGTLASSGTGISVGTATDVIRTYTLTAPFAGVGSTTSSTVNAGERYIVNGERIEILIGGTATADGGEAGSMTDTSSSTPATVTVIHISDSQLTTARTAQQTLLSSQLTAFDANTDPSKDTIARTLIVTRQSELTGGTSDISTIARRLGEVSSRITDINSRLVASGFYDDRYDTANQRASFGGGSLGQVKSKRNAILTFQFIATDSTSNGTELVRLQELIAGIDRNLTTDDNC